MSTLGSAIRHRLGTDTNLVLTKHVALDVVVNPADILD